MCLIYLLEEKADLFYYTFEPLNKFHGIVHGFSTRKGGTSLVPYDTLNLGLHVKDKKASVIENRKRFVNTLGYSLEDSVALDQVHGNRVIVVNESDKGRGMFNYDDFLASADGMVTNKPGILLTTYYADCVPLYFFDPQTNSIGIAHAGWKGTMLKIGARIVNELHKNFGANPKDCIAVIGPSIGPCCYEVDDRVLQPMKRAYPNFSSIIKGDEEKAFLNLWEANRISLQESGLLDINIYISKLCTHCSQEYFFSHRRDKGETGRMAAVIGLSR
ncbi:peptidoglycan editing factor PgeF [Desulfitibacter alkalitolerans]|uniref:peptidoglycan editing factor PgeF n=1 Tax=Desulfitibacter alkalitolerans TaxID=264641 RepID=UPI000484F098|nr:peptidoglycan editing factor PgeF [Desulfitibacter alkalitolerans]